MSDHRISISAKLLEKHQIEFLQFTDEALGSWRRQGLSQGKSRCGSICGSFSTLRKLVRVTEDLCKGKQIYHKALLPIHRQQYIIEISFSSSQTKGKLNVTHSAKYVIKCMTRDLYSNNLYVLK